MQPYDRDRDEIDGEWERANEIWLATVAPMTDDEVRALGRREVYPGYFENDPRYEGWDVHDRYLMDHPGPDWKTKPRLSQEDWITRYRNRKTREPYEKAGPSWEEHRASLGSLDSEPTPAHLPTPSEPKPKRVRVTASSDELVEEGKRHTTGLWLCRSCHREPALWPSERAWRREVFGVQVSLIFRSPLVCTNCRAFNFPLTQRLGRQGRRPFWQRVIQVWEGTPYPTAGRWTRRLARWRNRLFRRR